MNLVFMNSLEKKIDDNNVKTAQVLIQESDGVWKVIWIDNDHGKQVIDHWFEGESWDEMLTVFRYKLAEKLAIGYMPALDSVLKTS